MRPQITDEKAITNIMFARTSGMPYLVLRLKITEVTPKTFIYVDADGDLDWAEKAHREGHMEGALYERGYVFDESYADEIRQIIANGRLPEST